MPINQGLQSFYQATKLAQREVELIICHVLDINTAGLIIYDQEITDSQQTQIHQYLQQRVQGMPFAYITGCKEFWTLNLKVTHHTLIPRPETEQIVELVLKKTKATFSGNILDLGTGTGAIALSIASERPKAKIIAIDISLDCIEVAKYNKIKNSIKNVDFIHSHWFANIHGKFDFIVSNPPYISENDSHLAELKYEPITALTAKKQGLADIHKIIHKATEYLVDGGFLILEHGYNQSAEIHNIFKHKQYINIKTYQDLAGIPRVSLAQKMQNLAIN